MLADMPSPSGPSTDPVSVTTWAIGCRIPLRQDLSWKGTRSCADLRARSPSTFFPGSSIKSSVGIREGTLRTPDWFKIGPSAVVKNELTKLIGPFLIVSDHLDDHSHLIGGFHIASCLSGFGSHVRKSR